MSKFNDLYASFCNWVSTNPTTVVGIEAIFTYGSMALCAKSGSRVLQELFNSASKLMILINDIAIIKKPFVRGTTLKIWLSVVEHCEVLFEEIALLKGHGNHLIVIYLIQMMKCLGRLYLIKHYNEFLISIPPFEPLDSNPTEENGNNGNPRGLRTYRQSAARESNIDCLFANNESYLKVMKTIYRAEIIFTLKPLLHLLAMLQFGNHSWKPWLLSLTLDVISNRMLFEGMAVLPKRRLIIIQRYTRLLLYLLRSPLYEHIVQTAAIAKLINYSVQVPIFGFILKVIFARASNYRNSYFYLWSH